MTRSEVRVPHRPPIRKFNLSNQKATLKQVQPLLEIFTHANKYKIDHNDRAWAPGFSKEGWGDRENGQAGYIKRLAIHGDYHGQHIGEQIIEWAADQVRRNGQTRLRLDCTSGNKKLCTYYENLGFKQIEIKHFPEWSTTSTLYERAVG